MFPMGVQTRPRNPRRGFVSTSVSAWVNFTPRMFNPLLWLDAADASTITASSGAVSQWDDKSGNGYNFTQATSSAQPTTGSFTQNGLNLLRFDGGDALSRATDITTSAYTLFIVYSNTNVGSASAGQSLLSSISTDGWWIQRGGPPNPVQDRAAGLDTTLLFDTSTKRQLTTAKYSTTGPHTLRANRVAYVPGSFNTGSLVLGHIGRRFDGNNLKCDICEIVVFDYGMGLDRIGAMENYLAIKWAVY